MENIKKFSVENNLNFLFHVDAKPVYIDDAFNNVMVDTGNLNVISFYKLLEKDVNSVRVFRKPIIGILHNDSNLGKAFSYFGSKLGLFVIDLGFLRDENDIDRGFKLSDILVIATSFSPESRKKVFKFITLSWIKFAEVYVSRYQNNLLILVDDDSIVSAIGVLLYFIRPYVHYFFKEPILFNPIDYIKSGKDIFEVYAVDASLNIVSNFNSLFGYKIICNDGIFLERIVI